MKPYYEDDALTLMHGDSLEQARHLVSGAVQTIVTSPPYFGLRDYGEDGQIGAEETPAEYVESLRALFSELRRTLADDGTLWLNLGDSYGPDKNLMGVPWRVAFALQDDGWILRSDIIWAKPSVMPESVTDRPTRAHEYLFLFAKSPNYYYDGKAIAEPAVEAGRTRKGVAGKLAESDSDKHRTAVRGERIYGDTRNKRDVWTVATQPFPGAHFAVYPPDLIRPCVLAGSAPGDTVLDPFSGSGTTGQVATQEGRRYVGIDLNRDYLDLSLRTRFAQPVLNLEGIA